MTVARGVVIPASGIDRSRAHEDLALLAASGATTVRVGVDWSWMQPTAGARDGDAVEFYLGLATAARELGIVLQLALLEREVPNWFDNEGGFGDPKWAGHWCPRWVEACAESFGDSIGGWVPIDNPLGVANRLYPKDPRRHGDVLSTVVDAWRDAWRVLRGGPPVTTAFALEIVRPADQTIPYDNINLVPSFYINYLTPGFAPGTRSPYSSLSRPAGSGSFGLSSVIAFGVFP